MVQYKVMLKQWVETERSYGHSVDVQDLILQWTWFVEECIKKLEGRKLEPEDRIISEFHWDWLGEIITETRETIRETIRETMQETVGYGRPHGRPETIRETIVNYGRPFERYGRPPRTGDHTGRPYRRPVRVRIRIHASRCAFSSKSELWGPML